MPPSAISGTPLPGQRGGDVVDGHDLRHADAGHDARGADRARADADLHRVGAGFHQRAGGVAGGDVAADHVDLRIVLLDPAHAVDHALALWPCAVSTTIASTPAFTSASTRSSVPSPTPTAAPTRSRPLASRAAFGKLVCLVMSLTVIRPLSSQALVDDQQAFELVLVQQRLRFGKRGAVGDGDQLLARRHDLADRHVVAALEAQVAPGHDAHHLAAIEDRKAGDAQFVRTTA
jgi:hypothetical protein